MNITFFEEELNFKNLHSSLEMAMNAWNLANMQQTLPEEEKQKSIRNLLN